MSDVDPRLLALLVCPITKMPLVYDAANQELISRHAGLAYPIKNGVPVMLEEEARILDVPDVYALQSEQTGENQKGRSGEKGA